MEETTEKRVWQRVRGEPDLEEVLRRCLGDQAAVLGAYRMLGRRGGKWRRLLEQKERQLACIRGLLRVLTGQWTAQPHPETSGGVDLMKCFTAERQLLDTLTRRDREDGLGLVFAALAQEQQKHLCLLLELMGTM